MTNDYLRELYSAGVNGCGWYHRARCEVQRLADWFGIIPRYAAELTAILSPRVHVKRNAAMAVAYLESGSLAGAIYATRQALAHWNATGEIRGPKTGPFAMAIDPTNADGLRSVVVDVWTWRVFYRRLDFGKANVKRRNAIIGRITRFADSVGDSPANAQARLWCGFRALAGLSDNVSDLRFEL